MSASAPARISDVPPSAAAPSVKPPDWRRITQALLLVIVTVVCYLPSFSGGFLWDDRAVIVNDPLMKSAAGLWRIWFSTVPPDYYPLDYTSLWFEWHLWGADPLGYRLVNLALHIASACFFWRLLTIWRVRGAWYASLLFALHPLSVASVAWIVERKNVLSMVFYLGALLCWAGSEQTAAASKRRALYLGSLGAFALALGSKSSVVMLPCVLLLVGWWRCGRIRRADLRRTLPFFGLALAAGLVSLWFQHRTMLPAELVAPLPPITRALLIGKTIWFYLGKLFYPYPLVMIYPRWQLSPAQPPAFFPLVLLVLICAATGWLAIARGWRGPAAALTYFCLSLLPVAGLFQLTFYAFSYVSDHLVYVALPGMCALCAAGLALAWDRPKYRLVSSAAGTLIIALCAVLTWQRAADFGSAERLWRKTIALNPNSAAAENNYGLSLEDSGQARAAEECFRTALRLEPATPEALTNLAGVLRQERRWPEATTVYRQALAVDPEPETYNDYGVVLMYLGDPVNAAVQFRQALLLNPTLSSAHFNLYKLALAAGDKTAARVELRACKFGQL